MVASTSIASSSSSQVTMPVVSSTDETAPLLGKASTSKASESKKKPFYRARPMWLVPFAIVASVVRGMTIAPRVEVYTQLSCNNLYGRHDWNHTQHTAVSSKRYQVLLAEADPVGPHLHHFSAHLPSIPQHSKPLHGASSNWTVDLPSSPALVPAPDDIEITPISHSARLRAPAGEMDPRRLPSKRCTSDPAVQAGAARLQTIMTTTMGLLSALTTGWWGGFGERHGRTRVLAISTLGLLLTDLTFILVSTPGSILSRHGHKLLIVAPVLEGLLGGWSTLQSTTSAYISDCTSPGSRAQIFSRFTGVFYVGFAVGPAVGGWLISESEVWGPSLGAPAHERTVTLVFWAAICCSMINFFLVLLIFPESLGTKTRESAVKESLERKKLGMPAGTKVNVKGKQRMVLPLSAVDECEVGADLLVAEEDSVVASSSNKRLDSEVDSGSVGNGGGVISHFLRPLAVFMPMVVYEPSWTGIGFKKRTDWSLTILAAALFGLMLSTGVYQIKYLYAVHTYSWGAEKLGYYISMMGGLRAIFLLFLLPIIIGFFKPKPPTKGKATKQATNSYGVAQAAILGSTSSLALSIGPPSPSKDTFIIKPKPTRAQLGREITFDLMLTRLSLVIDIIGHSLVACLPAPNAGGHHRMVKNMDVVGNEAAFVLASALNGFGAGSVPAIHSLALCLMQLRVLGREAAKAAKGHVFGVEDEELDFDEDTRLPGTGELFGALAVLQAVGQMILGPMLFGLIYSDTVADFPKTVFVVASAICFLSLLLIFSLHNPVRAPKGSPFSKSKPMPTMVRRRRDGVLVERGRSRVSKDLRGGAIPYYHITSPISPSYDATSSATVDATRRV
ncbi:major facilitator superfamily domain-containing protein [Crepidotus variabilis]|uniref:Major facilitator superfamily domain-containing protein n=1 Tax=Crepidotus variabilis TaxID=179855 RepID=A0A9P6EPV9_9AGAR|nr:major facilitator superfamily domain-containing protein [Crepidotus variabilis]